MDKQIELIVQYNIKNSNLTEESIKRSITSFPFPCSLNYEEIERGYINFKTNFPFELNDSFTKLWIRNAPFDNFWLSSYDQKTKKLDLAAFFRYENYHNKKTINNVAPNQISNLFEKYCGATKNLKEIKLTNKNKTKKDI